MGEHAHFPQVAGILRKMPPAKALIGTFQEKMLTDLEVRHRAAEEAVVDQEPGERGGIELRTTEGGKSDQATLDRRKPRRNWMPKWLITLGERVEKVLLLETLILLLLPLLRRRTVRRALLLAQMMWT